VSDCHGFVDETFGQDESACLQGCEAATAAEQQVVLGCIDQASCDVAGIAACEPMGSQ
jgi:hypothetical protein